MPKKTFTRRLAHGSWCAVLSSLLASCGGGERGPDAANAAAGNGGQSIATSGADVEAGSSESVTGALSTTESGWYFCSHAGSTCAFSGTRLIRYGASGLYSYKSGTSSVACNDATFGDPAPGATKTCSISSSPSPYKQDAALYNLTFRDDFSTTALDTSKWNDHIWYERSAKTNDYGVGDGYLKIWPQKDANGKFNSRILTTYQKFSQTHGYFEMEAKLPIGRGVWPAFWLLNSDDPINGEPEIDIMEAYPGDKNNDGYWGDTNRHPIAYGTSFYQNGNNEDETKRGVWGTQKRDTGDLSAGFHKYAVKWEPNKVSFYFDGELFYTREVSMSKKMYLLVDIQYGSESGTPDATTPLGSTNPFQINYIRAWQFK